MRPLVVIGDSLLDRELRGSVERLAPDAPVPVVRSPTAWCRPGGAALAAVMLAASGREVVLVTALAADAAGCELRSLLDGWGVETLAAALRGGTPEKVRVHGNGRMLLRLDHCDESSPAGRLPPAAEHALAKAGGVLVSDYGKGMTAHPQVRDGVARARTRLPVVWDPHPRGAAPVDGVRVVTPNGAEAAALTGGGAAGSLPQVAASAQRLLERWRSGGVAVTLGGQGALLVAPGAYPLLAQPPERLPAGADTCGAGDRFAAEVAAALAAGGLLSDAVVAGVEAASAFLAAGGVATVDRPAGAGDGAAAAASDGAASGNGADNGGDRAGAARDPVQLARQVRAAGGTVVATGGCFDLLHAGHVDTLRAARALGDCLIVCLNSDASVRRLKGPRRPVVAEADRAAVLSAIDAVDAIAVFDDDTPAGVLEQLRPHVWVKGADYAAGDLPEAATLAAWGGQAVVVPYRPGHSTTGLIDGIREEASGTPTARPQVRRSRQERVRRRQGQAE